MKHEISCEEVLTLLKTDYLDNELDAATRKSAEQHLAQCPACRRVIENLVEITRPLRRAQRHNVPESVWASVHAELRRQHIPKIKPAGIARTDILELFSMRPSFAAAAAAAILIVISAAFYLATQPAMVTEAAPDLTSLLGNGEIHEPNTSFGSYIEQYLL